MLIQTLRQQLDCIVSEQNHILLSRVGRRRLKDFAPTKPGGTQHSHDREGSAGSIVGLERFRQRFCVGGTTLGNTPWP